MLDLHENLLYSRCAYPARGKNNLSLYLTCFIDERLHFQGHLKALSTVAEGILCI